MPGDNPILRHWQAQRRVLQENYSLLRDQVTVDAIHDLRVAIKKLRSYTKLHTVLIKKDNDGQMSSVRKLFSVLGKHRNMDIAKKMLLSFTDKSTVTASSLLVYLQLIQDQITPFCQQTIQAFTEDELDKFTNEMNQDFENVNSTEFGEQVRDVIVSGIKTVKQDMLHFKKSSHLIRKHLKDIFYWSHLFDEEIFFKKAELKTLDKILDHLGTAQDHEVLIKNVKNFRKTILADSLAEYGDVRQIEIDAEKKKNSLLTKAHNMSKALMTKVKADQDA